MTRPISSLRPNFSLLDAVETMAAPAAGAPSGVGAQLAAQLATSLGLSDSQINRLALDPDSLQLGDILSNRGSMAAVHRGKRRWGDIQGRHWGTWLGAPHKPHTYPALVILPT